MAFTSSPPQLDVSQEAGVQDDDVLWTEYLKVASDADARLVKNWTKVIDDLLVFVALFSAVLTAFIIQTSANFQPQPADVTNKILIAIYRHTMNASTPINLEQFLRLDDTTKSVNDLHNWLLYMSLALSILVAALAMATKLWLARYTREVTTSGAPRACAKRRQEVYDGLVAWRLEKCIDAMPIMALTALFLFGFFIHSSVSVQRKYIGDVVGVIFLVGISFLLVASFSAAFISDSPFRSPFSDFVNYIFRIFPNKPLAVPGFKQIFWRTIGIVLASVLVLAPGGYFVLKQNYVYFLCIYFAIASVFALMREGRETDMQPRFISPAQWVLISSVTVFIPFIVSSYFANRSPILCNLWFVFASILLCLLGYIGIKMSETRPMTVEAEAVSWLLTTSSCHDKDPSWFRKAVQIAGQSSNVRAVLMRRLLPLLLPLISSLPEHGPEAVKSEQEGYINTLAILMDFAPQKRSLWRNEASLERPTLPEGLIDRLKNLQASGEACSHRGGAMNHEENLWNDGTVRCPQACVSNAVEHILQLYESDKERIKDEQETLILKTVSAEPV